MLACCEPLRSDGALVEYEPEGRRYWSDAYARGEREAGKVEKVEKVEKVVGRMGG